MMTLGSIKIEITPYNQTCETHLKELSTMTKSKKASLIEGLIVLDCYSL